LAIRSVRQSVGVAESAGVSEPAHFLRCDSYYAQEYEDDEYDYQYQPYVVTR
jgi:hypothetical protein